MFGSSILSNPFIIGIGFGLVIAIPVGPITVLYVRHTLTGGLRGGYAAVFGATCARTFYSLIAGFSITWLSAMVITRHDTIQFVGSFVLIYLGIKTLRAKAITLPTGTTANLQTGAYLSTLLVTLTNPVTILPFTAICATLGQQSMSSSSIFAVLSGVFVSTTSWGIMLCSMIYLFRALFNPFVFAAFNRISGLILTGMGLYLLLQIYL